MTKEKALSILFSCADQYKSNLADRNWLLLWGTSSPSISPRGCILWWTWNWRKSGRRLLWYRTVCKLFDRVSKSCRSWMVWSLLSCCVSWMEKSVRGVPGYDGSMVCWDLISHREPVSLSQGWCIFHRLDSVQGPAGQGKRQYWGWRCCTGLQNGGECRCW